MSPRAVVSVREGEEVAAASQEPRKWGEREVRERETSSLHGHQLGLDHTWMD